MLRPITPHGILSAELAELAQSAQQLDLPTDFLAKLNRLANDAARLDPYLKEASSQPSAALNALEAATLEADWPALFRNGDTGVELEAEMLCGAVEAAFLATLVRITGARRILEVGMFTGYSALALAEALPEDGTVLALEREPYLARFSAPYFEDSAHGHKIAVRVGDALDSLAALKKQGQQFDLVFIDAHKAEYQAYCEAIMDGLLAEGGCIAVDNTLLQGQPFRKGGAQSESGQAIQAFNTWLASQAGFHRVLVPLRDGVTLITRNTGD